MDGGGKERRPTSTPLEVPPNFSAAVAPLAIGLILMLLMRCDLIMRER